MRKNWVFCEQPGLDSLFVINIAFVSCRYLINSRTAYISKTESYFGLSRFSEKGNLPFRLMRDAADMRMRKVFSAACLCHFFEDVVEVIGREKVGQGDRGAVRD